MIDVPPGHPCGRTPHDEARCAAVRSAARPETPDDVVALPLVLVVDDAAADRDLHCLLLRAWGLRPVAAADGWEALVCARTLLPALIVTDLRMPQLDGRRLLTLLRAAPATARIPVLVVTGETNAPPGTREPVAGSPDVLEKPVDVSVLRRAVEALLDGRSARADVRPPEAC